MALSVDYSAPGIQQKRQAPDAPQPEKALQSEVARIIFDRYAPPGVVVDADLQIVQFRGQTGAYLEPAPGEASLNLLKMAREGLLYGLRTALHAVRKSKAPVRRTGLRVKSSRGWKPVSSRRPAAHVVGPSALPGVVPGAKPRAQRRRRR